MRRQIITFSLAIAALWCANHCASAAIMYGDFDDIPPGVVMYTDVTESSATDPISLPLFGAPTIVANDLDFDPMSFGATAPIGPSTADLTDGQLNFGFTALPGRGLSGLAFCFVSGTVSAMGKGAHGREQYDRNEGYESESSWHYHRSSPSRGVAEPTRTQKPAVLVSYRILGAYPRAPPKPESGFLRNHKSQMTNKFQ